MLSPRAMVVNALNDANCGMVEGEALEESLKNWIETMDIMRLTAMARGHSVSWTSLTRDGLRGGCQIQQRQDIDDHNVDDANHGIVVVECIKGRRQSRFKIIALQ